jgi:hypothetical protein
MNVWLVRKRIILARLFFTLASMKKSRFGKEKCQLGAGLNLTQCTLAPKLAID